MDKQELQNLIAECHARLSPRLQNIFSSLGWLETIKSIADRYKLDQSQADNLSIETTILMLGAIRWDDYKKHLFDVISLPQSKLDEILAEIKSFVYGPVESELIDAYYTNAIILDEIDKNIKAEENTLIQAELDKRFKTLEPKIQKIIEDSNYQVKIYSIGQRNNLTIAQITELEEIITETILGTIPIGEFERELERRANLPQERVGFIVSELNEKILRDIRSSILALNQPTRSEETKVPFNTQKSVSSKLNVGIEAEKKLVPIAKEPEAPVVHDTSPIIGAKMQDSFAVPKVTTEYTLGKVGQGNIQKQETPEAHKSDPYRLDPNE